MSERKSGGQPADLQPSRVDEWFIETLRQMAYVRGQLGMLTNTPDWNRTRDINEGLWQIQGNLEMMQLGLFRAMDIPKARNFSDCYEAAKRLPRGRDKPSEYGNQVIFDANKQDLFDRFVACEYMIDDLREFLASRGLFGFLREIQK